MIVSYAHMHFAIAPSYFPFAQWLLQVQDSVTEVIPGTLNISLGTLPFKADSAVAGHKVSQLADAPKVCKTSYIICIGIVVHMHMCVPSMLYTYYRILLSLLRVHLEVKVLLELNCY
jgi:hypothetical protein